MQIGLARLARQLSSAPGCFHRDFSQLPSVECRACNAGALICTTIQRSPLTYVSYILVSVYCTEAAWARPPHEWHTLETDPRP